jgi:hypothetical protein
MTLQGLFLTTTEVPIDHDAGTLILKDTRVECTWSNAFGHTITKDGGVLVVEKTALVQTHASANGINAGSAQDVLVYGGVTKQANHANVIEVVSSLIVNSSVV